MDDVGERRAGRQRLRGGKVVPCAGPLASTASAASIASAAASAAAVGAVGRGGAAEQQLAARRGGALPPKLEPAGEAADAGALGGHGSRACARARRLPYPLLRLHLRARE